MITFPNHDGQLRESAIEIEDGSPIILTGTNNSGKTTLLRNLVKGRSDAYFVSSDRVNLQGEGARDKNYFGSMSAYVQMVRDADSDNADKRIQILQDLFELEDDERSQVIEYFNEYFPGNAAESLENPKNSASPHLLTLNGYSITKAGSGARAILEILVKLFDSKINLLCIDEPEIALEPKLQKNLYRAIKNKSHQKQIIIATHSHHFLDREIVGNNYVCSRDSEMKIILTRLSNQLQVRNLIFELLGNELSDLGLPTNLLIVEGISETHYISKCLEKLGKTNFVVFAAGSDTKIKNASEGISQYLKFTQDLASVYLDRIWILSDVQNRSDVTTREWRVTIGDSDGTKNKVCELPLNGIEYFYPERIIQEIFSSTSSRKDIINEYISTKPNSANGLQISKAELSIEVSNRLSTEDLDEDTELNKFLKSLPSAE